MNPTCHACKFWEIVFTRDDTTFGMCRRYPPVPYYDTEAEQKETGWPITDASSWCGEFVVKLDENAVRESK